MRKGRHTKAERICCDGRCTAGECCPAFAPGVIESYRMPVRRRLVRALRGAWAWLAGGAR